MSKIRREWRVIQEKPEALPDSPIRQVYVWILTRDEKVVIVSKDGENWQLPGGKPDANEDAIQAAVRETREETGIELSGNEQHLTFFGEYTIHDPTPDTPPVYRQVRSWIRVPETADELKLTTGHESTGQRPEDAVRFVETVPIDEVHTYIPWLPQADEYKALKRTKVINI
jgi:8-oxo-dGTP pyrophosphatase MutT (NUDIX family)